MRKITDIVVHASATPKGQYFDIHDIRKWHLARNFNDVGYHYVVLLDGTIQIGRQLEVQGAHVKGYNRNSIGICYIGGGVPTKWEDTRTNAQKVALVYLIGKLKRTFRDARVFGHRDYAGVKKACPCFDAMNEYKNI